MLACRLWSYEDFLRDKLHLWVGNRTDKDAYAEVDRRRRMNGKIVSRCAVYNVQRILTGLADPRYQRMNTNILCWLFGLHVGYVGLTHVSFTPSRDWARALIQFQAASLL